MSIVEIIPAEVRGSTKAEATVYVTIGVLVAFVQALPDHHPHAPGRDDLVGHASEALVLVAGMVAFVQLFRRPR